MEKFHKPFSPEQVYSFNEFQLESSFRAWKCTDCHTTFIATLNGLYCYGCNRVIKEWAWDWMLNWEWKNMSESINKFLNGDHSEFSSRFRKQIKQPYDKQ